MVYQVIQIVGAAVILAAYALQNMKRLHAETAHYQALNLVGGILLCIAAVAERQYGFIILEGSWSVLSAWGLLRVHSSS
ncbi:MAG: hypothetical protein JWO56_2543 [Acidobacteria bacterium]|nr:hypothetical protein [Acidobacteriota bacterium]